MLDMARQTMQVQSPAFAEGETIPSTYASSVSPPLSWSEPPPGTRSLAIVVDDPDAPGARPFVHWVVWNIPASRRSVPQGVPPYGMFQSGRNSFGDVGYNGPQPPPGSGSHHYRFHVIALPFQLTLAPGSTEADLTGAIGGRELAWGSLTGLFAR